MPTSLNFLGNRPSFVPAELRHDTNGWYIYYSIYNPVIDGLEHKRMRLNQLKRRCRSSIEFRMQAQDIINTINTQIFNAYKLANSQQTSFESPIPTLQSSDRDNMRCYKPLTEVANTYIDEKKKSLRDATLRSYSSFRNILNKWVDTHYPKLKVIEFTKVIAVEFMEDMEEKNLGPRTYNNMLRMGSSFFTWAKKKCYTTVNPFEGHERKRVVGKNRDIIEPKHQILIDQWFMKNHPVMRIVCRMVYTSLLRPIEITRIKVKQIDFENHCIFMPSDQTKTWEKRMGRMDEDLENLLRPYIAGANPEDYLFSQGWVPGKIPFSDKTFRKCWDKMRSRLTYEEDGQIKHLPDNYQLYSLKDTAITHMLKSGVDDLSVMQAAGHKDLSITTIYANHVDKNLIKTLNEKAPRFAAI